MSCKGHAFPKACGTLSRLLATSQTFKLSELLLSGWQDVCSDEEHREPYESVADGWKLEVVSTFCRKALKLS